MQELTKFAYISNLNHKVLPWLRVHPDVTCKPFGPWVTVESSNRPIKEIYEEGLACVEA